MRRLGGALAILVLLALGLYAALDDVAEATAVPAPTAPGSVEVAATAAIPPPAAEAMPAPFVRRPVRAAEPGVPRPSETASYCDEANWRDTDVILERPAPGAFAVDETAWQRTLTGTRVGLAGWMSRCHQDGEPIQIVSASTGALLATYDASSGLSSSAR